MDPVYARAASTGHAPGALETANRRKKPSYKIEKEHVVTQRRKLIITNTTITKPPSGYTFLALGHGELADCCKELSRKKGANINVVSEKPRTIEASDPAKVSHHVHRIGYHIRSEIFDEACTLLGYRIHNGRLLRDATRDVPTGRTRAPGGWSQRAGANHATGENATRIRAAVRELFPKIPEDDINDVIARAWKKGANTVGNATDVSFPRKVQLAVISHIRHVYTDYDKFLGIKTIPYLLVRQLVEPGCLQKLVEWRGDHDGNNEEFEEILRETIVIDDDDADGLHGAGNDEASDSSVEIVAQPANWHPRYQSGDFNRIQQQPQSFRRQTMPNNRTDQEYQSILQGRWHEARSRQRGVDASYEYPEVHMDDRYSQSSITVNVPLNSQGRMPRKIVENGVEYIRIEPDHVPPQHSRTIPCPGEDSYMNNIEYFRPYQGNHPGGRPLTATMDPHYAIPSTETEHDYPPESDTHGSMTRLHAANRIRGADDEQGPSKRARGVHGQRLNAHGYVDLTSPPRGQTLHASAFAQRPEAPRCADYRRYHEGASGQVDAGYANASGDRPDYSRLGIENPAEQTRGFGTRQIGHPVAQNAGHRSDTVNSLNSDSHSQKDGRHPQAHAKKPPKHSRRGAGVIPTYPPATTTGPIVPPAPRFEMSISKTPPTPLPAGFQSQRGAVTMTTNYAGPYNHPTPEHLFPTTRPNQFRHPATLPFVSEIPRQAIAPATAEPGRKTEATPHPEHGAPALLQPSTRSPETSRRPGLQAARYPAPTAGVLDPQARENYVARLRGLKRRASPKHESDELPY